MKFVDVSAIVGEQLPGFVRHDHPRLGKFLKAYYAWLEQVDHVTHEVKSLLDYQDIDTTEDRFLQFFRKEFLVNIPDAALANKRLLVKHIRKYYRARGTEKSYELLFRILFNSPLDFYYPWRDTLKVSDGKWVQNKSIRVSEVEGVIKNFYLRRIRGMTSKATAVVADYARHMYLYSTVYELILDRQSIQGTFIPGETVFVDNPAVAAMVYPLLAEIQITDPGRGYRVNEKVQITDTTGRGAVAEIQSVDENGSITRVSILDPGVLYSAPDVTFPDHGADTAKGTASTASMFTHPGYYLNNDGQLSTTKYVQDSYFYQQFSYVLKSSESIRHYREVVKRLLHPAGFLMFGGALFKSDLDAKMHLVGGISTDLGFTIRMFRRGDPIYRVGLKQKITNLVVTPHRQAKAFGFGPTLHSLERYKFHYRPSSFDGSTYPAPNDEYWGRFEPEIWTDENGVEQTDQVWTAHANAQVKDFGEITIAEMRDKPWKKTHYCVDPAFQVFNSADLRNEYAQVPVTLDLNPDDHQIVEYNGHQELKTIGPSRGTVERFVGSNPLPVLTRKDNRENQIRFSEGIGAAYWSCTDSSLITNSAPNPIDGTVNASFFREDAISGEHWATYSQECPVYQQRSELSGWVKNAGRRFLRIGIPNSVEFVIDTTEKTLIPVDGIEDATLVANQTSPDWLHFKVRFTYQLPLSMGLSLVLEKNLDEPAYQGDNNSGVYVWGLSLRAFEADSQYLSVADEFAFRGMNGRIGIRFLGTNECASPSTLDEIVGNSFTSYVVFTPEYPSISTETTVMRDANDRWKLSFANSKLSFTLGGETVTHPKFLSANEPVVAKISFGGGNLSLALNGGAEVTKAVAGNTDLSGALRLGGTDFYGKLWRVIVSDAVHTSAQTSTVMRMLMYEYGIF